MKKLLCFGYGYVAQFLIQHNATAQLDFSATINRNKDIYFSEKQALEKINFAALTPKSLDNFEIFVISIPPFYEQKTDIILEKFFNYFATRKQPYQLIYLSATSVYGDQQNKKVAETAELKATTSNGLARIACEKKYLELTQNSAANIFILRLAGIYGPKRNQLEKIQQGKKIAKFAADKIISRIHVADITNIILKLITQNKLSNEIFNLCDEQPSTSHEMLAYISQTFLAGETIAAEQFYELSKNYSDAKIPDNQKLKQLLNYEFIYPNYKSGLKNCATHLDL